MSHEATNWAIKQRGLSPAAKIVLWHLCDRYHPDHGCFPSQATLARDCEISESSLNNHLNALETAGLIARERRADQKTRKRRSTIYRLAFEEGFQAVEKGSRAVENREPSPEFGDGNEAKTISKNGQKPSPNPGQNHLQNLETNPVREPVREPVIERERATGCASVGECADGRAQETQDPETVTRASWIARFRRAHKEWPTFATDSVDTAQAAWFDLSEAERTKAAELLPAFVAHATTLGRSKFCAFSKYLQEKRWERLPETAMKASGGGSAMAAPYGRDWGALRFANLMRAPYGRIPPATRFQQQLMAQGGAAAERMIRERTAQYGWPKVNTLHEDALRRHRGAPRDPKLSGLAELFGKVKVGGALFEAWKALHAARGWPFLGEARDLPEWIYMPATQEPVESYESLDGAVKAALARFENAHAELQKNEAAE
ncbi:MULTISPECIES: helix-turn-helix domain-containing protein [unclassified Roseibium]|uniref:helix-turn-helix domain-containing protein n=1 Tax=unclassified Roseibium TaxID=2629323 RepID=UPI00273DD3D9|nr:MULTISPECIES: helix-turn-helix domain-containing protein [unclassified Roseibium]